MERKDLLSQMFYMTVAIQTIAFFIFFLTNYEDLDTLEYTFEIPGFGEEIMEFDFYDLLLMIALLYGIVIILSVTIIGIGLNAAGSWTIMRFVSSIFFFLILGLGISYYLQDRFDVLVVVNLLFTTIFVIYLIVSMMESGD